MGGADNHRAAGYAAGGGPGCADGGIVGLAFAPGGVSGVASGGVGVLVVRGLAVVSVCNVRLSFYLV